MTGVAFTAHGPHAEVARIVAGLRRALLLPARASLREPCSDRLRPLEGVC